MRKKILITGASSGLGAEMARQFAAKGCDLALCARRTERLARVRDELTAAHPDVKISVAQLDVDDHDAVFQVFQAFAAEFGSLDRVVVNAGLGKGQPIGTGGFEPNRQTAMTNFVAALAQCEAAMEIFRRQNTGHLVMISSLSAVRGFPGNATTYAASKAAASTLAEGIRVDVLGTPIKVTTIQPGYIRSEMNDGRKVPMMAGTERGVRAIVNAIEKEKAVADVPLWPWAPLGVLTRILPRRLFAKMI
ncbi:MAG: SDR family oxidoreductase [Kibdelosporangium sp.]